MWSILVILRSVNLLKGEGEYTLAERKVMFGKSNIPQVETFMNSKSMYSSKLMKIG